MPLASGKSSPTPQKRSCRQQRVDPGRNQPNQYHGGRKTPPQLCRKAKPLLNYTNYRASPSSSTETPWTRTYDAP